MTHPVRFKSTLWLIEIRSRWQVLFLLFSPLYCSVTNFDTGENIGCKFGGRDRAWGRSIHLPSWLGGQGSAKCRVLCSNLLPPPEIFTMLQSVHFEQSGSSDLITVGDQCIADLAESQEFGDRSPSSPRVLKVFIVIRCFSNQNSTVKQWINCYHIYVIA